MVTLVEVGTPLTITFCVRAEPSSFRTLMLALEGIKPTGVTVKKSNPRTSCSPPMKRRENGGISFPPYPVSMEPVRWKARMWVLCHGAGLKYLKSTAGLIVLTFPPRPATSAEMYRLRPAVGFNGWLTVLYRYDGVTWLVLMPVSELGPATPLKLMYWK